MKKLEVWLVHFLQFYSNTLINNLPFLSGLGISVSLFLTCFVLFIATGNLWKKTSICIITHWSIQWLSYMRCLYKDVRYLIHLLWYSKSNSSFSNYSKVSSSQFFFERYWFAWKDHFFFNPRRNFTIAALNAIHFNALHFK